MPEILPAPQISTEISIDQDQAGQQQQVQAKTGLLWEPFIYEPPTFLPIVREIKPPLAPRRAPIPNWPVRVAARKAAGGVPLKRKEQEEELLVILSVDE
jgi:hypothetical protein